MLKLKKWLTFGLLATAVAVFIPACTDDEEDEDAYRAEVRIEGGVSVGVALEGEDDDWRQVTYAYEGERVYLFQGHPAPGSGHEFIGWSTVPANVANSITPVPGRDSVWQFFMPSYDVTVTAVWAGYPQTYIRFTWEAEEEPNILAIAASYTDVANWYSDVFYDPDYDLEDATALPLFDGSSQLPDNIYSSTLQNSTQHKGVYYELDVGEYTAIGSGEDSFGYFDIVANYEIRLTGYDDELVYAELGFDFGAIIEGMESPAWEEEGWFFEWYDSPNTAPMLQKSLSNRGITIKKSNTREFDLNGSAKMKLTYYLVRRPKA